MSSIIFRCTYGISTKQRRFTPHPIAENTLTFTVRLDSGEIATVSLSPRLESVEVHLSGIHPDEDLIEWLEEAVEFYRNAYPDTLISKIDRIKLALDTAARTVVEAVKYYLGKAQIEDNVLIASRDLAWSKDGSNFRHFPSLVTMSMSMASELHMSDETRKLIQEGIDTGRTPLLAMRHLYRAIQETVPRFKWIDATIAAELAVKEVLIRAHPGLETLLINMPSPPLSKLYGEVLEKYLGERSPFIKALDKGSQRRNKLIHRPNDETVSEEEASMYVNIVMQAIHHLYACLYPDWKLAKALKAITHLT